MTLKTLYTILTREFHYPGCSLVLWMCYLFIDSILLREKIKSQLHKMVQKCIFCRKKNGKGKMEEKRTFHKFPDSEKYPHLFEKWISNMNLKSNTKISRYSRLCSDHFEENNLYIKNKNIYLKPGSVPTLFLNNKIQCVFCKANKSAGSQSFHKFPINKPDILNMWLSNMKMENFFPISSDVLCSDHFDKNCFLRHGQRKTLQLKKNAIPTVFISRSPTNQINSEEIAMITNENNELFHLNNNTMTVDNDICTDSFSMPEFESSENQTSSEVNILNQCAKTPQTSILTVLSDHNYINSPRTLQGKYLKMKQNYILQAKKLRVSNQRISRLKKKVANLKDIVSELHKNKDISESGLLCLDSLTDADISQFLRRFTKNRSRNASHVKNIITKLSF